MLERWPGIGRDMTLASFRIFSILFHIIKEHKCKTAKKSLHIRSLSFCLIEIDSTVAIVNSHAIQQP